MLVYIYTFICVYKCMWVCIYYIYNLNLLHRRCFICMSSFYVLSCIFQSLLHRRRPLFLSHYTPTSNVYCLYFIHCLALFIFYLPVSYISSSFIIHVCIYMYIFTYFSPHSIYNQFVMSYSSLCMYVYFYISPHIDGAMII